MSLPATMHSISIGSFHEFPTLLRIGDAVTIWASHASTTVFDVISSPRHQLARRLASAASSQPSALSVRRTAPTGDLDLEVRGVGPLALPVTAAQAKELRLVARPAHYGLGTDTLLDRSVRDTWEVPRSRVKINTRRWNNTLTPMLDRLRADLGLPEGCRLKAELHSMLVYEPGQFFAPHQDSEKSDDMIASLVVMLPSNASGGDLVVGLGDQAATHRPSRTALTFVAFYSDTVHEIRPVTAGYRVVLTYNLLARGSTTAPAAAVDLDDASINQLAGLLNTHFSRPADVPSWRRNRSPAQPPDRLVYLLDHQYTERGMSWNALKGVDAHRAAALRAAAEHADCQVALALAEVHEIWQADEDDWHYRGARGRYEPPSGATSVDGYELLDLIEDTVMLTSPAQAAGDGGDAIEAEVDDSERCESTPSLELDAYDSQYEGYMGNYGNTMDRWYLRGAVVVWPTSRAYVIRARANPVAGLLELVTEAADTPGDPSAVRDKAAQLAPFWSSIITPDLRPVMAGGALLAARLVDGTDLASMLVKPFDPTDLRASDATALVELVDHYGIDWADSWLTGWAAASAPATGGYSFAAGRRFGHGNAVRDWVGLLAALCTAVAATEGRVAASVNRSLVEAAASWLTDSIDWAVTIAPPSLRQQTLEELGPALRAVLEATAVADATAVRRSLTNQLCGAGSGVEADPVALPALVAAVLGDGDAPTETNGLAIVGRYCIEQLEVRLARPPRADDDWSIERPDQACDCDDCQVLQAFLHDAERRQHVWPLAKPRRQHIHQQIDGAELPVTHQTRREGSPHKLVLTKADDLVQRDQQTRRRIETELAELRRRIA